MRDVLHNIIHLKQSLPNITEKIYNYLQNTTLASQ